MAQRKGKSAARRCRAHEDARTAGEIAGETLAANITPADRERLQSRLRAIADALAEAKLAAENHPEVVQARHEFEQACQGLREAHAEGCREWERLTGDQFPDYSDTGAWRRAAVRFGLPAEKAFGLEFTANDVWDFLHGQKAAEKDRELAAERAALAARRAAESAPLPVPVEDEWASVAKRLKGKALAVLWLMNDRQAFCASGAYTRDRINVTINGEEHDAKNALAALRKAGVEAFGRSLVESSDCGSWLTSDGRNVAARLPDSAVQEALKTFPRLAIRMKTDKAG